MKKLLALCGASIALGACVAFAPNNVSTVYAEGETEVVEPAPSEKEPNGWDKFVADYLNADKVAMYLSWMAYIGTIIGLVANIKKLKKANSKTLEEVSREVQSKLEAIVKQEITEEIEKFLPAIKDTQEKINDTLKIFAKILALSQENTPESRVAILNLIEELGTIGKEIVDNAKEVIEEEVKAIEEHKEEIEEKLDEIIESYDGTSI